MNKYIQLAGCKYATKGNEWIPRSQTPAQVIPTLSGRHDVVYSKALLLRYEGTIIVPNVGATGYGDIDDFRLVYRALAPSTFIDHFGATYSVVFLGTVDENSLSTMWDGASNRYHIPVALAVVA